MVLEDVGGYRGFVVQGVGSLLWGGERGKEWVFLVERDCERIRDGVGGLRDEWFEECVLKKVGDEVDTFCKLTLGLRVFPCV
jgi:hypothetical protein